MADGIVSPAASIPGDFGSAVDAAFDNLAPAAPAETAAPPPAAETPPAMSAPEPPAEPEPEPEPPAGEPAPEPPAAEPPPAEPEPEVDPSEDIQPDRVSPDGKMLHFRAAKAKALLADRQFANSIREKIPNVTVEQLEQHYTRTVALDEQIDNVDSGDPARVAKAADWFLKGATPQGMGVFADHIVRTAAREHPEVYRQISSKVIAGYTQSLYNQAVRSGDKNLLALAQNLDFQERGRFIKEEEFAQRDPHADREADLARRERELAERVNRDRTTFIESQMQVAHAAEDAAITEEIDKALAPVASAFKSTPHWKHMTRDIRDAIEDAKKANPTWMRQYNLQEQKVRSNPSEEAKANLVTMMRQFVAPVIARSKKSVIEAHTQTVMGNSAAAHQKQQQAAQRREPAGSNNPVQRATLIQQVKGAKNLDDALDLIFR